MALAHKGLEFESIPTGFVEVPQIENGATKIVPLIRDGDKLVSDSFEIAQYLESAYPDRPSLFKGEGGVAMARLIERWSQLTLHPFIGTAIMMDIFNAARDEDKAYFRKNREGRFGRKLEDIPLNREQKRGDFSKSLEPLRNMLGYQPYIGGASPLFPDYIVFGAFQFARVLSPFELLDADNVVNDWFNRCLELHNGTGASVAAAS